MVYAHASVMAGEVARLLKPQTRKRYLDGTVGGGGHTEQILIDSSPEGQDLGLDRDDEALAAAAERLKPFSDRVKLRRENFSAAQETLEAKGPANGAGVAWGHA